MKVKKYLTSDSAGNWGEYFFEKVSDGYVDVKFRHSEQFGTPYPEIFVETFENFRDEKLSDEDKKKFIEDHFPTEPFFLEKLRRRLKISTRMIVDIFRFAIKNDLVKVDYLLTIDKIMFRREQ